MATGMATKKVTITLDENELTRIRELVAEGMARSVSAFVQNAVTSNLDDATIWKKMLADSLEKTGGPPTDEETAWLDQLFGGTRK